MEDLLPFWAVGLDTEGSVQEVLYWGCMAERVWRTNYIQSGNVEEASEPEAFGNNSVSGKKLPKQGAITLANKREHISSGVQPVGNKVDSSPTI